MPEGLGVGENRRSKARHGAFHSVPFAYCLFTEGCTEPVVIGPRRQAKLRCAQLTCSEARLPTLGCGEKTYGVYCKCQVQEWEANPEVTAFCMVLEVGVCKGKSKEAGINGFCGFS